MISTYTKIRLVALAAAVLLGSLVVWQSSTAAFTASDDATASWDAGVLELTADEDGQATLDFDNITPGDSGFGCVVVDVTSSLEGDVELTGQVTDGAGGPLATALDAGIERTEGQVDCDSADSAAALEGLGDLADGTEIDSYTFDGDDLQTFRLDWEFDAAAGDAAQGESVQAEFTWQAESQ